jgi:hypothetical protein
VTFVTFMTRAMALPWYRRALLALMLAPIGCAIHTEPTVVIDALTRLVVAFALMGAYFG